MFETVNTACNSMRVLQIEEGGRSLNWRMLGVRLDNYVISLWEMMIVSTSNQGQRPGKFCTKINSACKNKNLAGRGWCGNFRLIDIRGWIEER